MGMVSQTSAGTAAASIKTVEGLSVAIISFNEEANIARCIEAVKALASEIVVVDSFSSDNTVAIAESLGAKVYSEPWKGFVAQKNSALEKCNCDWTLFLDCDEEVSAGLAASLVATLAAPACDGYRINRKTWFMGRWIEHAWYPDWNIRLIRRGAGRWQGLDVHETLVVPGAVGSLNGDLNHYSFKDLRDLFERSVRYAAAGAESYRRSGKKASLSKLLLNPLHGFFKHYILKKGFLDGFPGFLASASNGIYVFMKYAFLWEQQRSGNRGDR
jgi:glycosyltransferase involved in cell wall biosynthesis